MAITDSITKNTYIPLGLKHLGHVEDINQIIKENEFSFCLESISYISKVGFTCCISCLNRLGAYTIMNLHIIH